MYCNVCGGPFTPYNIKDYPAIGDVDTAWLNDAIIEYNQTTNNLKVNVCYYDSYGRFEEADGTEHDVIEGVLGEDIKVYHKLCESQTPSRKLKFIYQQQFFDIDRLIKDGKAKLLEKPNVDVNVS